MDNTNLSLIASQYQTCVSEFTFDGSANQEVLAPNGNRWFVQFIPKTGAGTIMIIPATGNNVTTTSTGLDVEREYKFRDCPSIVIGGFVGSGVPGVIVIIVECIYIGG